MIVCTVCGSMENTVKDTRVTHNTMRRRRACQCGFRWTTYELPAVDMERYLQFKKFAKEMFGEGLGKESSKETKARVAQAQRKNDGPLPNVPVAVPGSKDTPGS